MLNRIFKSIVQPYFVRKKTPSESHSSREVSIQLNSNLLALKHIIHRNVMLAIQISAIFIELSPLGEGRGPSFEKWKI